MNECEDFWQTAASNPKPALTTNFLFVFFEITSPKSSSTGFVAERIFSRHFFTDFEIFMSRAKSLLEPVGMYASITVSKFCIP